ncbi:hypothetical protein TorRG33x02_250270, partial [Trema orientale]
IKCVFLGYSSTQKGYKCYHPPSRTLYVSADITFTENKLYFTEFYLQGKIPVKDKDYFFGPLDLPGIPSPTTHQKNDQIPEESVSIPTPTVPESIYEPVSISAPVVDPVTPVSPRPYDVMRFPPVY